MAITVDDAIREAWGTAAQAINDAFHLYVDDDSGVLVVSFANGAQVYGEVHESGVLEYWTVAPELPSLGEVLTTLIEVSHTPVELAGLELVGGYSWTGGGDWRNPYEALP